MDPTDLESALARAAARRDETSYRPTFFDPLQAEGRAALAALAAEPGVVVVDALAEQLLELVRSRAPRAELNDEGAQAAVDALLDGCPAVRFGVWVFYPWLSRLVHVLPRQLHRELRLDRNRFKITSTEQTRLLELKVAVAGLSVGRAVVSTLAREGIGGELRLADFDTLSLSNLNRVAGGLVDVGVSKVVLAAREVAELDPFIVVVPFLGGVQRETLAAFVDGADVLVDECDDLSMKLLLREQAKASAVPLVMATSDRGMLDVERFDREPDRAAFHGVLAGIGSADLDGLTTKQKIPYILRILDAERLEDRMAASLVEVKETLSTWPQLASGVVLGGAMVANVVRRIALDEIRCSGRFLADLDVLVADGQQASLPLARPWRPEPAAVSAASLPRPAPAMSLAPSRAEQRYLVACATTAPSGGNAQPWRFEADGHVLRALVDPARGSSLMDDGRASLLALGGALEGATIGAAALGLDAVARVPGTGGASWELTLTRLGPPGSEEHVRLLGERSTNRRNQASLPIADDVLRAVGAAGAPLDVAVVPHDRLASLGAALGAVDRVRFISSRFRAELVSEVRWTREEALAKRDGIDTASLELDATDLAVLEVLRTGSGMGLLRHLGEGHALGNAARTAFERAGGALVLRVRDGASLVEAGRGLLRLWLEATRRDLGVHPWGAPLLFTRLAEAAHTFEPWERESLVAAAAAFAREAPSVPGLTNVLVLRLRAGDPPSARSVRRDVDDVLRFV